MIHYIKQFASYNDGQIEGRMLSWGTPHPVTPHPLGEYWYVGLNMTNTQIIRSALMATMETSSSFLNLIT